MLQASAPSACAWSLVDQGFVLEECLECSSDNEKAQEAPLVFPTIGSQPAERGGFA